MVFEVRGLSLEKKHGLISPREIRLIYSTRLAFVSLSLNLS